MGLMDCFPARYVCGCNDGVVDYIRRRLAKMGLMDCFPARYVCGCNDGVVDYLRRRLWDF